ncbi:70-kilodalton heat shock protein, partial [Tulasnella sp. 408]
MGLTMTFKSRLAAALDVNDGIERPGGTNSRCPPRPVTIAYGLDKQRTGEHDIFIFDPGEETLLLDHRRRYFRRQDPADDTHPGEHRSRVCLSPAPRTSAEIDSPSEGIDFYTSITLVRFEELCRDLSRSTHNAAQKVLRGFEIDKSAVNGIVLTPEEISAVVPGKMKWTAEAYLGEKVNHPVVAVPAYFNDAQRRLPRTP